MITKEQQLKSPANFMGKDGHLYLVRCLNCEGYGERGRENYAPAVSSGTCAFCGWHDDSSPDISSEND